MPTGLVYPPEATLALLYNLYNLLLASHSPVPSLPIDFSGSIVLNFCIKYVYIIVYLVISDEQVFLG